MKPLIIGIAGGSASGKSSLCDILREKLEVQGIKCCVLSLDFFYKSHNENYDCPAAYSWNEIRECLLKIQTQPGTATHPVYDYRTHSRTGEIIAIPEVDCYLIEGILVLYDPEVLSALDLKIFVDAEPDTRLIRRIKRDLVHRARDVTDIIEQYEQTVKPGYDNYICPTKGNADFIVPNEKGQLNAVAINFILKGIKYHF